MASKGKKGKGIAAATESQPSRKRTRADDSGTSERKKIQIDDDDFADKCIVPIDETSSESDGETFTVLSHRSSPKTLIDAISEMNDLQQKAVYEMGFGSVFKIRVREIPCRLAYWCVDSFRPRSCSLSLLDGKSIHISDRDVWLTLGFPQGSIDIERNPAFQKNNLIDRWAAVIGKKKKEILPADVISTMLSDASGGHTFRQNFLVLLEFCLIEAPAEGHVRPKILDAIQETSSVNNLNWCKYLLSTLIHCHTMWTSSNRRRFTGSVLFLMMFYVDRVEIFGRSIQRAFPTVSGWTSAELLKRQATEMEYGMFGEGYVAERYVPSDDDVRDTCFGVVETDLSADCDLISDSDPDAYTDKLVKIASSMMSDLSRLLTMISDAPDSVKNNPCFQIAVDACKHLFGVPTNKRLNVDAPECGDDGPRSTQATAALCSNWTKPEWDQWLADMLDLWERRNAMSVPAPSDIPSFSIGLTQELRDVVLTPTCKTDDARAKDDGSKDKADLNVGEGFSTDEIPLEELGQEEAGAEDFMEGDVVEGGGSIQKSGGTIGATNKGAVAEAGAEGVMEGNVVEGGGSVQKSDGTVGATNEGATVEAGAEGGGSVQAIANADAPIDDEGATVLATVKWAEKIGSASDPVTPVQLLARAGDTCIPGADKGKQPVAGEPHAMHTRGAANIKPSTKLTSPYAIREVPISGKLSKSEKTIFYWVLSSVGVESHSFVYDHKTGKMTFDDARTLQPGKCIACGVLNAWSSFLNLLESLKAPDTYSRFYFSTFPVMKTVVDPTDGWDENKQYNVFSERLDEEVLLTEGRWLSNVDLVCIFYIPLLTINKYAYA